MNTYARMKMMKAVSLLAALAVLVAWASPAAAGSIQLDARWIDGRAYVDADELTRRLGGSGAYDAENGTYTYRYADLTDAIASISPSVVAIIGRPAADDSELAAGRFQLSHGTGVMIREDGWIVTNAHVVKELMELVVVTPDGKQLNGRTVAMDEESDLALVRVNALGLKPAALAASGVSVGETVAAVGTPISFALRNTVTVGVISGVDRSVNATYQLLQTDAAINPGNSGGPLVNVRGEVVGINSLKYADVDIDNLGFAIPADTVAYVVDQLMKHGEVRRPYLGAGLAESWAAVVGLPSSEPLSVNFVAPGSPADKAGIREGDVLAALDGKPFTTIVQFNELLRRYEPGTSGVFTVRNGSGARDVSVTFASSPGSAGNGAAGQSVPERPVDVWSRVGSERYLVNGTEYGLPAPVASGGVTMVPIELFALAYGADDVWSLDGPRLDVQLGSSSFSMTIGSVSATVNGEAAVLPAPPQLVGGQPIVPYRYVAEALGMQLHYYDHSGEMLISGELDDERRFRNTSNIDRDEGKSRIGDSYYGWTMNYPSSLIYVEPVSDGSWVSFYDAGGVYWLSVGVEPHSGTAVSDDQLLKLLSDSVGGQVLSKRTVRTDSGSYAQIRSKSNAGTYQEHRAYYDDKRVYYVTLNVYEEAHFKHEITYGALTRLLDSFAFGFDPEDASVKDLSQVSAGGAVTHRLADYGVQFELPKEWSADYYNYDGALSYSNDDDADEWLSMTVTSVKDGDALPDWVERKDAAFADMFLPEYRELAAPEQTVVSGLPAYIGSYRYTFDLANWTQLYAVYVFAGDYKYEFALSFGGGVGTERTDDELRAFLDDFVRTLQVNPDRMDSSFGYIEDVEDLGGRSGTKSVVNEHYGYSFEVPAVWEEGYSFADDGYREFYFLGGSFSVEVLEATSVAEQLAFLTEDESESSAGSDDYELVENRSMFKFGTVTRKLVVRYVDSDGAPGVNTIYLLERDGDVYMVVSSIYDAVRTDANERRLEDAIDSFAFLAD